MTDYLILGGGSAGCVLAARLSEDGRNRVHLVEAGRDLTPETMAPAMAGRFPGFAYLDPENVWSRLTAAMAGQPGGIRQRRLYEQGRVLGAGNSVSADPGQKAPMAAGEGVRP